MTTSSEDIYRNPEIRKKIEILKNYLWKFDKDMDNSINKEEMLSFFDSNMPNGKKYDREVANKLFKIFDLDDNGKISVEEFIKTFIHLEEELKEFRLKLKAKYLNELSKCNDLKDKLDYYKSNEVINDEGISNLSNINFEVQKVEFPFSFQNIQAIKITLVYGDKSKSTNTIKLNKLSAVDFLNESINLDIFTKKHKIVFNILEVKTDIDEEIIIGSVELDLNKINEQDDFELTLEIPENENDNNSPNITKITSKAMFIWSYFQYYTDLVLKSENNVRSFKASLEKSENIINSLNEPFNLNVYDNIIDNDYMIRDSSDSKLQKKDLVSSVNVKSSFNNTFVNAKPTIPTNDNFIFNKTNQYIKEKLKVNIHWMLFLRILLFIMMIIAFLNSVVYSELVNITLCFVMYIIISSKLISTNPNYYCSTLIQLGIFMMLFDIIFIVFNYPYKLQGYYINILNIVNTFGFALKIVIVISSIIIKVESNKVIRV